MAYLYSSGFSCTLLWLFSDPHGIAISQPKTSSSGECIDKVCFFKKKYWDSFITSFIFKNI